MHNKKKKETSFLGGTIWFDYQFCNCLIISIRWILYGSECIIHHWNYIYLFGLVLLSDLDKNFKDRKVSDLFSYYAGYEISTGFFFLLVLYRNSLSSDADKVFFLLSHFVENLKIFHIKVFANDLMIHEVCSKNLMEFFEFSEFMWYSRILFAVLFFSQIDRLYTALSFSELF